MDDAVFNLDGFSFSKAFAKKYKISKKKNKLNPLSHEYHKLPQSQIIARLIYSTAHQMGQKKPFRKDDPQEKSMRK
ncbi:MAG: hypothetical protein ACI8ZN_001311 [Bacteroidia bacterium]